MAPHNINITLLIQDAVELTGKEPTFDHWIESDGELKRLISFSGKTDPVALWKGLLAKGYSGHKFRVNIWPAERNDTGDDLTEIEVRTE